MKSRKPPSRYRRPTFVFISVLCRLELLLLWLLQIFVIRVGHVLVRVVSPLVLVGAHLSLLGTRDGELAAGFFFKEAELLCVERLGALIVQERRVALGFGIVDSLCSCSP